MTRSPAKLPGTDPERRPVAEWATVAFLVTCARCNLRVQYDRDGLLMAGGDRGLTDLLTHRAEGLPCAVPRGADVYDRCLLMLPELGS